MELLGHRVADKRVLKNNVGAAQGGAISPLLANIYLHYVLDLWFEKKIKPRMKGRSRLIRYADDLVVAFANEADCQEFKVLLKTRLEQFKLKINESKNHITKFDPPTGGTNKLRRRHISLLGFKIFLSSKRRGRGRKFVYKTQDKSITQSLRVIKDWLWRMMHLPVEHQARYLNSVLRGHFNYFGLAGNGSSLNIFRNKVLRVWRRVLSRRS